MIFFVSTFIIGLLFVITLVMWQVRQIRKGVINPETVDYSSENILSHENLIEYRNSIRSFIEVYMRQIFLYALKVSIKIGYFVKMKLDAIVSRIHRTAAKHERIIKQQENSGESTADFLNKISDYKEKLHSKFVDKN